MELKISTMAVPPQAIPIAWNGVAVALNVYLAHTRKRI
jgi:hypothetical protein